MAIHVLTFWQYMAILIACHHIGDFAFQSAWMAMEKAKDKEVLVYHALTQAAPFMLLVLVPGMHVTLQGLMLHVALHIFVDYLKGKGVIKKIWQDQACHHICMLFEHLIGWL